MPRTRATDAGRENGHITLVTRRRAASLIAGAGLALAMPVRRALAQAADAAATQRLPRVPGSPTLRITWGSTPSYSQIASVANAFTDATGVRLEFQALQQVDRYQKMVLDTASNTNSFDIYITAYQWKEQIAPFAADLTALGDVPGVPAPDWSDYPQRALDAYSRLDGKLVTVPLLGDASLLVWDKEARHKAGLPPDVADPSWDAVYQSGVRMTGNDRYGYNMPAGKSIQTACQWITLFHGLGGRYFDAAGKPSFDSPAGVSAIRLMAERLGKVSPPGNLTWDFPEMINSLATGQSSQGYMWGGCVSTLFDPAKSAIARSIGWAPTPQATLLGGWGLAVNARGQNLDTAKLFVGWLTSPEISRITALVSGTPCRTSAFTDKAVVAKFPILPAMLDGMQGTVATYVPIKDSEQINILIYDNCNAACAGTKPPEQAAADLQAGVTALMKRRGYLPG